MNLNFLDRFSKNRPTEISDFMKNPSSGRRVVPCGQTDRYDEANNYFSAFLRTRLKVKGFVRLFGVAEVLFLYGGNQQLRGQTLFNNVNAEVEDSAPSYYVDRSLNQMADLPKY
jgi:hypothetical protein